MAHQSKTAQTVSFWAGITAGVLAVVLAFAFGAPAQALAAQNQDANALRVGSLEVTTQAAPKVEAHQDIYAGDYEKDLWDYLTNWDYDAWKITKVVSSNAKVLKVKKVDNNQDPSSYDVYPLKAGKAKLTVTYKVKSKTKKVSGTFTVKTCPAAIKSMKLNGKALKAPTPKTGYTSGEYFQFRGTSATFALQLANGWEVGSIYGYFDDPNDGSKSKEIDITNGKKFTIPKKYEGRISFSIHDADWEEYFYYTLQIYRGQPMELDKSTYYAGHPKSTMLNYDAFNGDVDKIQIVSVKSSKPAVIKMVKGKKYYTIKAQPKKVGKAKLSVTYKYRGKTYTTSAVNTVVKYPLKSVTLNGKALNLVKNPHYFYNPKYKKSTAKVKFTPVSGWKVSKVQFFNGTKSKTIKNGATVKLPKNHMARVRATFKKGRQEFIYAVYLG